MTVLQNGMVYDARVMTVHLKEVYRESLCQGSLSMILLKKKERSAWQTDANKKQITKSAMKNVIVMPVVLMEETVH